MQKAVLLDNLMDAILAPTLWTPFLTPKTFHFPFFIASKALAFPHQCDHQPFLSLISTKSFEGLDYEAFSPWNNLSCNPRSAPSTNAKLSAPIAIGSNCFCHQPLFYITSVRQPDEEVFIVSTQFSCFA